MKGRSAAPGNDAIRLLVDAVESREKVGSLTHKFYLYPARLSPELAGAAIRLFTAPGDLVFDPFVGGGTTLVEAAACGRRSIGSDINELAVFVSQAKTAFYSSSDLRNVRDWSSNLPRATNLQQALPGGETCKTDDPFRNANSRETWRVRKFLQLAVNAMPRSWSLRSELLARCILLRAGRWALDGRKSVPTTEALRVIATGFADEMCQQASHYRTVVAEQVRSMSNLAPISVLGSAIGIDKNTKVCKHCVPKLVLCSPPYPGTHVLYHRWQVRSRRETPTPYWIASCSDTKGASYYTMGGRSTTGLNNYFRQIEEAFASIAKLLDNDSAVVQIVSFSKHGNHLERYLDAMSAAGFSEVVFPSKLADSNDGRLWRTIPSRRWYTHRSGIEQLKREVVLVHKLEVKSRLHR